MGKKKKMFNKQEVVVNPIFEEEIKEELHVEEHIDEPVVEEPIKEDSSFTVVKEEAKKEIDLKLLDIVEISSKDLDFIPVRDDVFEFAGCEVKCIRNFGSRIFIKVLRQL